MENGDHDGESGDRQHRLLRIFGPPGTGKTYTLAARVKSTVAARGADSIAIASFSVTAAREIASRDGVRSLPPRAVGTLHSHAYRAIGTPNVALDKDSIKDWNAGVPEEWAITGDTRGQGLSQVERTGSPIGSIEDARTGDELLNALDLLRARQEPGSNWPERLIRFAQAWTSWKRASGMVDFCMDEQTEIFTARGWMLGDDVREGDLVRSINPETGLAEWQPVESVYRRRGRSPMVHMVNAVHDSVTTPDHRWLINRRNSREEWTLDWTTTTELNSTARIPRAAVSGDAPTEAKYADAFVELVAWWFTEGSYRTVGNGGQISQSHRVNPEYCARIEAALRALTGPPGLRRNGRVVWSISHSGRRGMTFYGIGGELLDELDGIAPDKVPTIDFLAQLTPAQLRMFVGTALDADGHVRAQAATFGQRDSRRTEAFATAASLAGMAVTFQKTRTMGDGGFYEVTVSSRRLHAVVPGTLRSGHNKGTRTLVDYDGLIWCPTVARHHNFLARRNGKTYFTGNTDMIVQGYVRARDGEPLSGNPEVFIVDEAQDFTPIETALAMAWSRFTDRTVFALDDDQAINEWRGGDPRMVLDAEADDEVLAQSHRVPPAVHAVATSWIEQTESRVAKEYHPRTRKSAEEADRFDVDDDEAFGTAATVGYTLNSPMLLDSLERDLTEGRDAMVLASCGYMLVPLIKELRRRGLPFHNPFRPAETAWNPLGSTERAGVPTAERVFRYLLPDESLGEHGRLWTGEDLSLWAELINLKSAGMVRGAGNTIKRLPPGETVAWETVVALFAASPTGSDALSRAVAPDLEWLASVIKASKSAVTSYPIQVARQHGPMTLSQPPQIVIGTTHSAKGATASRVYLAPDLSPAGMRQWQGSPAERDQTRRQFYVGMTRAFHDLRVLSPGSTTAVPPSELIPPHLEVRR